MSSDSSYKPPGRRPANTASNTGQRMQLVTRQLRSKEYIYTHMSRASSSNQAVGLEAELPSPNYAVSMDVIIDSPSSVDDTVRANQTSSTDFSNHIPRGEHSAADVWIVEGPASKSSKNRKRRKQPIGISRKGYAVLRRFYEDVYLEQHGTYNRTQLDEILNAMWASGNEDFTEEGLHRYIRNKIIRARKRDNLNEEGVVLPDTTEGNEEPPVENADADVPTAQDDAAKGSLPSLPTSDCSEVDSLWDDFMQNIGFSKAGPVQVLPVEGLIATPGHTDSEGTLVGEEGGTQWPPETWKELYDWMRTQEHIVDAVLSLPDGIFDQLNANDPNP